MLHDIPCHAMPCHAMPCHAMIPVAFQPGMTDLANGMEWNGMEWNGMEWNGMEQNRMEWNGMGWPGLAWPGMEWHGMMQTIATLHPISNMDTLALLASLGWLTGMVTGSRVGMWGKHHAVVHDRCASKEAPHETMCRWCRGGCQQHTNRFGACANSLLVCNK